MVRGVLAPRDPGVAVPGNPSSARQTSQMMAVKKNLEQAVDATFWLILGTFVMVLLSMVRNQSSGGNDSRLERKVDLILSHLGLDPYQGVNENIVELMKAGKKIQAIKLYRELTGAGLKEAKDYVESL
jgi:hypothetical protein